jgi:hypothetical protein
MDRIGYRLRKRAALAVLSLSILAIAPAPLVFSQTPSATPDGTFQQQQQVHRKPIPRSWTIAIVAVATILSAVALAFSVRAWRASNLFDREYRFPAATSVALRLGANKSGGCMATIRFRDRGDPKSKAG